MLMWLGFAVASLFSVEHLVTNQTHEQYMNSYIVESSPVDYKQQGQGQVSEKGFGKCPARYIKASVKTSNTLWKGIQSDTYFLNWNDFRNREIRTPGKEACIPDLVEFGEKDHLHHTGLNDISTSSSTLLTVYWSRNKSGGRRLSPHAKEENKQTNKHGGCCPDVPLF